MRQRIASLLSVLPLILLQQVIINKVVNTHCMTHISQCLCSYSLCLSAALPKDIINIRADVSPTSDDAHGSVPAPSASRCSGTSSP